MANTIRIKKRASTGSAGAPTTLAPSELAFNENSSDRKLYYGLGDDGDGTSSSVIAIGGDGAFTTLDTAQTISGNKTFTGTCDFSGATLSGNTTFSNNLTVSGNLVVDGVTTTVNSTTVTVDDKNIELGSTASPSDSSADGGGLTLKGSTDHTWNWVNSTDAWTSSEHIDLASGKEFKINGTSVLSSSTLGSGVTGSSLTSVGTIATGTWNGTDIGVAHGGTGASTASAARANLGLEIGSDVQAFSADLGTLSGIQTGAATALAALTSTEVAVIDGGTSATSTTLAGADRMVVNDAGTMKQVALSDLVTFLENGTASSFELDGGTF
tara:strand:+ start:9216 stop:10193 length:978 start_codon:yes stop_codon:yes gene_type:complete